MPLAYSYVRFSSVKQARGDSLRRQTRKAQEYAYRHGLTLDDSLTIKDLGVSAYDSSNVNRGALGAFLVQLRAGKIPEGSFLLVEQLDRLSRADVYSAIALMREIVEGGVTVVTLTDDRVFDKETVRDIGNIMLSVAVMFRAHEESKSKSERIGAYWQGRRELRPAVFTGECPRWLSIKPDRTGYEVIPDRAQSVKRIFELTAEGHGNVMIARRANQEKWAVPGKADSWHATLITKVLNNRAVLGEYQPHTKNGGKRVPIGDAWLGYYPRIIDDGLFNRAKASKASRAQLPRRRDDRYLNLFQGVIRCGECGSSLSRKYKGSKAQPNYVQYQCTDRIRALTTCPSISAIRLTEPLLRGIFEHSFTALTDDDFSAYFREELEAAEIAVKDERVKLNRVVDAIESAPESASLIVRLRELERSVVDKEAVLAQCREWVAALADVEEGSQIEGNVVDAMGRLEGDEHIDYRAGLHDRITRVISRIDVFSKASTATIHWKNSSPETSAVQLGPPKAKGVVRGQSKAP